ncbi:27 kDa hemolymph protein-like [Anopheles ziemanni]|uniref:27 kDa hemolymph protein-like n=1 Tax=Anopheles ziemanni TaxID=345580 RepID=UPI00265F51D2|nr:27 kDa hemolymph protein-like [Anopheles ziemanni]
MGKFSLLAALGVLALLAVTRAIPQPGSNSSSEEPTESRETKEESTGRHTFVGVVREVCRANNGSDEAYIALTEAVGTAIVCVMTSVDVKNFISDVDTISNETRGTFFPKYCPQLKKAGSCLDDLLKATGPCLEEDDFKATLAVAGIYPDAVDLICKNDGEVIFKLAEPKTKECVGKLRDNVMDCTIPFAVKSDDWDISHLLPTQVGAFSELRQCIEDRLNECEAPDLISVYGLFHNTLFRLHSCNDYMSKVTKKDINTV